MTIRTVAILSCAILSAMMGDGCSIDRGSLRLGKPRVYDSETTVATLANSKRELLKDLRGISVASLQEAFGEKEIISSKFKFGRQTELPDSAKVVGLPTPSSELPTTMPDNMAVPAFGRTMAEQINDLVYRENAATEVQLLYPDEQTMAKYGPNARMYKVYFDMAIWPTRQPYWLYPWLLLSTGFSNTYNFTEDWFAQITFAIPELGIDPDTALPYVFIYDIHPKYEVVTAAESLNNTRQAQLTGSYATPDVAMQGEYQRRLEEQFAQQRRYPMQLGTIEDPTSWSWTFGPRRHIRERGWFAKLNPFANTYEIESRLEPGERSGCITFLVPDIQKLRDVVYNFTNHCAAPISKPTTSTKTGFVSYTQEPGRVLTAAADPAAVQALLDENGPNVKSLYDRMKVDRYSWMEAQSVRTDILDQYKEAVTISNSCLNNASQNGNILPLPIITTATYLELDRPDGTRLPMPVQYLQKYRPRDDKQSTLVINLPIGPPYPDSADRLAGSYVAVDTPPCLLLTLSIPKEKIPINTPIQVKVYDLLRGGDVPIRSFEYDATEPKLRVFVNLPVKQQEYADHTNVSLVVVIRTHDAEYMSGPLTKGPGAGAGFPVPFASAAPLPKITFSPVFGGSGRMFTLTASTPDDAAKITSVQFGNVQIKFGDGGCVRDGNKIFLPVPFAPGAGEVDVAIVKDNKLELVGRFTYTQVPTK
jgi:hypothetical protein